MDEQQAQRSRNAALQACPAFPHSWVKTMRLKAAGEARWEGAARQRCVAAVAGDPGRSLWLGVRSQEESTHCYWIEVL